MFYSTQKDIRIIFLNSIKSHWQVVMTHLLITGLGIFLFVIPFFSKAEFYSPFVMRFWHRSFTVDRSLKWRFIFDHLLFCYIYSIAFYRFLASGGFDASRLLDHMLFHTFVFLIEVPICAWMVLGIASALESWKKNTIKTMERWKKTK